RSQRETLKDLRIKRYFQVPRANWQIEPGKVFEIATLPSTLPVTAYSQAVRDAVRGPRLEKILETDEYKKYRRGLERHARAIESLVQPGSEKKTYQLADMLDFLLHDRGKESQPDEYPNLTEFWTNIKNPKIATLRAEIE